LKVIINGEQPTLVASSCYGMAQFQRNFFSDAKLFGNDYISSLNQSTYTFKIV